MDDIVVRLRSLADCDARAGEPLGICMREAADEIEQLRARIAVCHNTLSEIENRAWATRGATKS